jgi:hypoxanthine phosphoribosyltransferase
MAAITLHVRTLTGKSFTLQAEASDSVHSVKEVILSLITEPSWTVASARLLYLGRDLDTGKTLRSVTAKLAELGPASLKTCVLLDKPERRSGQFEVDYVGFSIPNLFVVGYGLDYDERYRNLPFVGVLKPHVYSDPT